MAVAVFDHHDGRVHEHADGQRQSAQRHDVRADVQVVHGNEGREHGDGQRQDGHQRRAEVKEKDDDDEADDDGLLIRSRLSVSMDCVDQPGAVVAGDDLDAGRQRGPISASLAFTPSMTLSAFMP